MGTNMDQMDEMANALAENPSISAGNAFNELHYGRLEWLAEHIRLCNFQIDPLVARKILEMLEGSNPDCFFELTTRRRQDLPPRAADKRLNDMRDMNMAIEVARLGGFRRAYLNKACEKIAEKYKLESSYIAKQVRPWKQQALDAIAEETAQLRYLRGETDFLGRPKSP